MLLLLVTLAWAPSPAGAQPSGRPAPARPARPPNAPDDNLAEAKAHYDKGAQAYAADRWDEALKEFKIAWELSRRPAILFNIARTETKLGHEEAAIAYLKQYLEAAPDAEDAAAVRGEIAAREKVLAFARETARAEADAEAERRRRTEAEADARTSEADAKKAEARASEATEEARRAEEAARRATRPRWPAWAAMGMGGALLAIGVVLGLVAEATEAQVESGSGRFDPSLQTRGYASTGFGIGFDVLGAGLVGAGVGLYLWSRPSAAPSEKPRAWVAPAPGGLVVGGRF